MPTRLAFFLCLFSVLSFAESWSGVLVDSRCWGAEERNVNPTDTLTSVDRDTNRAIRYCSPTAKTKFFAIVQPDGLSFKLDSAGDAKAAELIRNNGRKSLYRVAVTGNVNKNTINVDSIVIAR
ncbi:MAG: hypothetical protein ABSG41_02980 [Bryobacteraceae bacterium]|jgi:hypothetical protein